MRERLAGLPRHVWLLGALMAIAIGVEVARSCVLLVILARLSR